MKSKSRYLGLRRTASREALLGAAEELFGSQAFASVSIDEIVERAGVAKGTFYNHFSGKEDIGQVLAVGVREDVRRRIGSLKQVSDDPAMQLAIAVTAFLDLARTNPRRANILANLIVDATNVKAGMNRGLRQTLKAGMVSGRLVCGSEQAALLTVLGIVSGGIRHIVEHPKQNSEALIVELVVHVLASFGIAHDEAEFDIARPATRIVFGE